MTVAVGWCDGGTTRGEFTEAVTQLCAYETHQGRLAAIVRVQSGPLLAEGRNILVSKFLRTDAEWLLMVDSDMTFTHDSVERLLATADVEGTHLVGGLCYGVSRELGQFPTMYRRVDGMPTVVDVPAERGVVQVDATGAAFTLTHRDVFEAYRRDEYHPWFHYRFVPTNGTHPGGWLGEDISWHWWLRDKGVPILVDTTVEAGHIKPTTVNSQSYAVAHATH